MRYVLYFFTLALVFTAGMLVGNFYVPDHRATIAAAVSVPDLDSTNPALSQATEENAQQALSQLTQALEACPVVVKEERDALFNQISLFLTLQDFQLKKAMYEAEIAKNSIGSRTTAKFSHAASEYAAAKLRTQQRADELFLPVVPKEQTPASTTENTTQVSTGAVAAPVEKPANK